MTLYLDAGTTYSKIIAVNEVVGNLKPVKTEENNSYYIIESKFLKN